MACNSAQAANATETDRVTGMDIGAVVLLGAVGFRITWRRHEASAVLENLEAQRRYARRLEGADRSGVWLCDEGFSTASLERDHRDRGSAPRSRRENVRRAR
jgi:hypothetical protein